MSFAKVHSAQVHLLKAYKIDVEVDLSKGLNSFAIVGLPDKAVAESKDRVSAAIKNCGFESPKSKNQKVVFSLAPADIRKEGPNFDVAMALAYLLAADDIRFDPKDKIFLGELSLDGKVSFIKGALPLTLEAKRLGFKEIYLPMTNAEEANIIKGIDVFGFTHLKELLFHLNKKGESVRENGAPILVPLAPRTIVYGKSREEIDLKDIKGQEHAKRALEISAAGGHNLMMYGPPGTGKSMLAKAFIGVLPRLSFDEILETTSIHSSAGISSGLVLYPPLRTPHHTASYISLIGGGTYPKPGEVTLAHRGVLFMDEFPEFDMRALEALRQPLEDKKVSISRSRSSITFPSHFILVATMNPCPCGNRGSENKECSCSPQQLSRYERKLSGPIIDRIDMWIEVNEVDYKKLSEDSKGTGQNTGSISKKVETVRKIQRDRFRKHNLKIRTNSEIGAKNIIHVSNITKEALEFLSKNCERLLISARGYHRAIRLARTIADIKNKEKVEKEEILEALQYRLKWIDSSSNFKV